MAISYYALGLFSYLCRGLEQFVARAPHDLVLGIAAPVISLSTWYLLRRSQRRMSG